MATPRVRTADSLPRPRGRITWDDGTTCVVLSEDEYERLLRLAEVRELTAKLAAPASEWVDFDEFKLREAGSRIAAARKAQNLTQTQLAHKLGLPQSDVSRIERHPDRTTVRTLKRVAHALGVDVKLLVE